MPDFKFWEPKIAKMTCKALDYPEIARQALLEMHRQVGDLIIDNTGLAKRGLLIRHLVLPHNLAGTREIMKFIDEKISPNSYVNIMSQYRPYGRASKALSDNLQPADYQAALQAATEEGITRFDERPHRLIWF
jgi:putative pyruvate formate lyase activating enzyme